MADSDGVSALLLALQRSGESAAEEDDGVASLLGLLSVAEAEDEAQAGASEPEAAAEGESQAHDGNGRASASPPGDAPFSVEEALLAVFPPVDMGEAETDLAELRRGTS